MNLDSVAGRFTTGLRRGVCALTLGGVLAALALTIAAPAQAHTPYLAKAWGNNTEGQLGDGTHTGPEQCGPEKQACSTTPVEVSGPSGVTALAGSRTGALGNTFSLTLLENGTVEEWGNAPGTSGDVPVAVSGLSGVVVISAGEEHGLALLSNGKVMAWGDNNRGELGNGTNERSTIPVEVSGLSGVVAIAAGNKHSLALLSNGTVMAWGKNSSGQLGNGAIADTNVPVEVSGLSGVVAIAGGEDESLALLNNGNVMAWGHNNVGQLGNGSTTQSDVPVEVSGLSGATAIASGGEFSLALVNGSVEAWGRNDSGQLGNGVSAGPEICGTLTPCSKTPVAVSNLSEVTAIAAGGAQSLALLASGRVRAWGDNSSGQLGDGTSTGPEPCGSGSCSRTPVEVTGLGNVKGIAAGRNHSLAFGPPPAVTKVVPKRGPVTGGTTVTITGTDFIGATEVKFGSTAAASFTVNSDTSITAVTPSAPAGKVDVTVANDWGKSATSKADRFVFRPTVTGLTPNSGPAPGGTSVTVTGSGFALGTTATRFRFGRTLASSVSCTSTTTCTVVSPAHAAGTVDVKAIVNRVSSPRNRPGDQFTYN